MRIPYSVDEVTPGWLTDALRSTGVLEEAAVESFESERLAVGQGFTGQITRLSLGYNRAEEGAPDSVIIKFPTTDKKVRASVNERKAYEVEVRFYEEVAAGAPVITPICYYGATDPEAADHVLMIEDLAPARVGDAVAGCTSEDAVLAAREIAKFHAAYWESPALSTLGWIPDIAGDAEGQQAEYQRLWQPFLEKYDRDVMERVPARLKEVLDRLQHHVAAVKRQLAAEPRTIVHGDYRPDNLIFGAAGLGSLTIIDWQAAVIGRGVVDIAYLVGFGMTPELRRPTEAGLLESYHSTLVSEGVEGYDFDRCLYDYRLALLNHLDRIEGAFVRLDFSSERGRRFVKAVFDRFDSVVTDHDFDDLLPS